MLRWKLLDAVSTPNLESIARCLTYADQEESNLPLGDGLQVVAYDPDMEPVLILNSRLDDVPRLLYKLIQAL